MLRVPGSKPKKPKTVKERARELYAGLGKKPAYDPAPLRDFYRQLGAEDAARSGASSPAERAAGLMREAVRLSDSDPETARAKAVLAARLCYENHLCSRNATIDKLLRLAGDPRTSANEAGNAAIKAAQQMLARDLALSVKSFY